MCRYRPASHSCHGPSQHLAHTLVGAALLLGTATAALASPVHALAATPARPARRCVGTRPRPGRRSPDSEHTAAGQHAHSDHQTRTAQPQTVSYVVPRDGRGPDTYWDIAEAHLGGGEHWQQIWELNRGRTQPDGEVMTNPGLLKPGWTILLPASAARHRPLTVAMSRT